MSRPNRQVLVDSIGRLVMRWQDATQRFDETMGEIYDLNAAERHCLSFLWPDPQAASAIAREVRLTPAAVTALIDRLERRGFVRREADPNDRRRVLVRATDKTAKLTAEVYQPIGRAGEELLATYSTAELEIIDKFAREALALQLRMTDELIAREKRDAG
jgi:DNA-binding MarR family transcriptional regulator